MGVASARRAHWASAMHRPPQAASEAAGAGSHPNQRRTRAWARAVQVWSSRLCTPALWMDCRDWTAGCTEKGAERQLSACWRGELCQDRWERGGLQGLDTGCTGNADRREQVEGSEARGAHAVQGGRGRGWDTAAEARPAFVWPELGGRQAAAKAGTLQAALACSSQACSCSPPGRPAGAAAAAPGPGPGPGPGPLRWTAGEGRRRGCRVIRGSSAEVLGALHTSGLGACAPLD